jgi:3-hydroxybutyryl-CoA dehydrogenase
LGEKAAIAVVGAGLMGAGIAQVFAVAGHRVALFDAMERARETALPRIRENFVAVGDDLSLIEAIELRENLADAVADADFVFEAAPEDLPLKQRIFVEIEAAAKPHAILASNTSVIPITRIVERLADKTRALGTHWWNPPYLVPLVEVIRTVEASDAAVTVTLALLASIGKTAVEVKKDVAGFVGNRLQHALWREAIALVKRRRLRRGDGRPRRQSELRPPAGGARPARKRRYGRDGLDAGDPSICAAAYRRVAEALALSRKTRRGRQARLQDGPGVPCLD